MDIGLHSFNTVITDLEQTTSLKVREYLSNGLPVMGGNYDPAFPENFRYVQYSPTFNLACLFDFANGIKGIKKQIILKKSKEYISTKIILDKLYSKITNYRW